MHRVLRLASMPFRRHYFTWLPLVSPQVTVNTHCSLTPNTAPGLQSQDFSPCTKTVCPLLPSPPCNFVYRSAYSQGLDAQSFVKGMKNYAHRSQAAHRNHSGRVREGRQRYGMSATGPMDLSLLQHSCHHPLYARMLDTARISLHQQTAERNSSRCRLKKSLFTT